MEADWRIDCPQSRKAWITRVPELKTNKKIVELTMRKTLLKKDEY